MAKRKGIPLVVNYVAVWTVVTIVLLLLVEGAASWALAFRATAFRDAGEFHTRYDSLLGWSSTPGKVIANAYGPGVDIRINSGGFRGKEVTAESPQEGVRIVCSGDSFTFGQGVGNGEDWCHVMSELSGAVEGVNMGQPGYGVDQAYLWYVRDGLALDPDLHFLAFVSGDFWRMLSPLKDGVGKPILQVSGDSLVTRNVPVPYLRHSIGRVIGRAELRLVRLGSGLLTRIASPPPPPGIELLQPIVSLLFHELREVNSRKGIATVLVYLPTENDIFQDVPVARMARSIADSLEVPFVDLTPQFRALLAHQAAQMFLSDGHYSASGHRLVAELLTAKLREVPDLSELLKPVAPPGA